MDYDSFYIGGRWTTPASTQRIQVTSASTEEAIGSVPSGVHVDVDAAVAAARTAFDDPQGWPSWHPELRLEALERFANALLERRAEMASRVAGQNGMPTWLAKATEGAVPATLLRYYSGLVASGSDEEVRTSLVKGSTIVRREPIGVVAAIVPWNFPQTLAFFKLAPALAAGCTVVLKPASETVLDAFLVAEAALAAELPPGVLNIVSGSGRQIGDYLVTHPGIDKVGFTGSTEVGRHLGAECGRMLRPVTLELGGKSASIILDDADPALVARELFATSLINSGQSCFISTRILAPRHRYDEFVEVITETTRKLQVGDPFERTTMIGPLVSRSQRDSVEAYIQKARAEGGRITTGGRRPPGLDRGWFLEPTIIAGLDNSATVAQEEIFGPVVVVIPHDGDDDAVAIANDSAYGLGGTVWTSSTDRGVAVARRIRTGTIGVNGFTMDHGSPFGGVKSSGLGRELGPEGLSAYQQYKSIYVP